MVNKIDILHLLLCYAPKRLFKLGADKDVFSRDIQQIHRKLRQEYHRKGKEASLLLSALEVNTILPRIDLKKSSNGLI